MDNGKSSSGGSFGDRWPVVVGCLLLLSLMIFRLYSTDKEANLRFEREEEFRRDTQKVVSANESAMNAFKRTQALIVSLAPNMTQIVLDLEQKDRISAVSNLNSHPKYVSSVRRVEFPKSEMDWQNLQDLFRDKMYQIYPLEARGMLVLGVPDDSVTKQTLPSGVRYVPATSLYGLLDVYELIRVVQDQVIPLFKEDLAETIKKSVEGSRAVYQKAPYRSAAVVYPGAIGKTCDERTVVTVAGISTPEHEVLEVVNAKNAFSDKAGYPSATIGQLAAKRNLVLIVPKNQIEKLSSCKALKPNFLAGLIIGVDPTDFVSSRVGKLVEVLGEKLHPGFVSKNTPVFASNAGIVGFARD